MRHKDVMAEHRAATKNILEEIEEVARKYDIHPDDYNYLRSKVKSKIFRLSNVWHVFFATVVDAKFHKKVNEEGEKMETHLINGEDRT
jgi:hypothetical protein